MAMHQSLRPQASTPAVAPSWQAQPTVTIGIPSLNEARHIERVIEGFLASPYPRLVEIVVADGGSTDDTAAIVEAIARRDPRVTLIHNADRIQSAGLNKIFAGCAGDIFLRADAHCDYAPDYVESCVEALVGSGALNVGGCQRFVATTPFQAGLALAARSPLGTGGAPYRDPDFDGPADTVFLGCFDSAALRAIACQDGDGPFKTTQITNQDAELNMRLRRRHRQAIHISSSIRVWYYPRKDLKSLWRQYFRYGRGRYISSSSHPGQTPLRSRLPFLGISGFGLLFMVDAPLLGGSLHTLELLAVGAIVPFLEALRVAARLHGRFASEIWRGDPGSMPSFPTRVMWCGAALWAMPLAHFSGYAYQLVRRRLLGVNGW